MATGTKNTVIYATVFFEKTKDLKADNNLFYFFCERERKKELDQISVYCM